MMSSMIISKAFTELLLNTFFTIRFFPLAETLQDIRDNKKIIPLGNHNAINDYKKLYDFNIDDILGRMEHYAKQFPKLSDKIEQVINGDGVLLYNSRQKQVFMELTVFYQDKMFVSDSKYWPDFSIFFIHRNQNFSELITF